MVIYQKSWVKVLQSVHVLAYFPEKTNISIYVVCCSAHQSCPQLDFLSQSHFGQPHQEQELSQPPWVSAAAAEESQHQSAHPRENPSEDLLLQKTAHAEYKKIGRAYL